MVIKGQNKKAYMKVYNWAHNKALNMLKMLHKEEFTTIFKKLMKGGKNGKENM